MTEEHPKVSSDAPSFDEMPEASVGCAEQFTPSSWDSIFSVPCWNGTLHTDVDNLGSEKNIPIVIEKATPMNATQLKEEDEVLGWTLDAAARGVAIMGTAVFVSTEILRLANEAAGCAEYDECDQRVYGMKPSSILTNVVMVVGLFSAFIMPLVGSIIDHTPYRKAVGSASAAALVGLILLQVIVIEQFWYIAAILQIFVAFAYSIHLCAVYAYLPELTTDHNQMVQYTAKFSAAQYGGSVGFLVLMVILLETIDRNERFLTTHLSQGVVFVVASSCFGYAWARLFRSRPARQVVQSGKSLVSSGFSRLFQTGTSIVKHHNAIKWLLVSISLTQAAATTFSTIAITYMTESLGFASNENGIAILILLLFGIPGTRLAAFLTKKFNPILSLQACLLLWVVSLSGASLLLRGPNQQPLAYSFAMIWGLATGWIYPSEKTLYVTIIPKGQEGELMGLYICAGQILSWLPPLVFSAMNEANVPMHFGLLSLATYFLLSFVLLFRVGDYNMAVDHAKQIEKQRADIGRVPTSGLDMDGYGCYQEWVEEEDDCGACSALPCSTELYYGQDNEDNDAAYYTASIKA